MSILETPRIAFRGRITWDPIVTNNYDKFYNENAGHTVFGPGETVAKFRESAIAAVTGGNWNPHGTHHSRFFQTQVASVDLGAGPTTDDAFVGVPVTFVGMLVDLDAYGAFSSQLFFDSISFGIDGGCQVMAPCHVRMTDRYINFGRNSGYQYIAGGASVLWQTSFPKHAGLRLAAHGSKALAALERALADDDVLGLTVRWCSYRTVYYDTPGLGIGDKASKQKLQQEVSKALQQKLEGGGFQPNPARSELVGTLGLWRRGEPAGVCGDRALVTTAGPDPAVPVVGSAAARLAPASLTIDLSNSIPETGFDLAKQDLGELSVVAVAADGKTVAATLGTLPYRAYGREAYDLGAGLVVLPVDPAAAAIAANLDLEVRTAAGAVILRETALRACPEDPNLYLDEGEPGELRVRVLDRGAPPRVPACVTLYLQDADPATARTVPVDAAGFATFPIPAGPGSVDGYLLVPAFAAAGGACAAPASIPKEIDPQVTDYVYVRILPADADIAKLPPTWDNVRAEVLADWEAMAPCMDNWLRLGDPVQVKAYGALVRRLTSKASFEGFRFMPVTRDLSAGKRALLYAWLDGGTLEKADSSPPSPPSPAVLSRAHRRG